MGQVQFECREGTWDDDIFREVVTANEYRLPDDMGGWAVLDVGGHIGTFGHACKIRGCPKLCAFEPHPDNYRLLDNNLPESYERIRTAVWPCEPFPALRIPDHQGEANTGGHRLANSGFDISFVSLVDKVKEFGLVDLMKLDCEGAEHAIVHHADLAGIKRVVGEMHYVSPQSPLGIASDCPLGPADFYTRLIQLGFVQKWGQVLNLEQMLFWYERP